MEIAIIAHDTKKELMTQFCIAYCGILSKHNICATGTTGARSAYSEKCRTARATHAISPKNTGSRSTVSYQR